MKPFVYSNRTRFAATVLRHSAQITGPRIHSPPVVGSAGTHTAHLHRRQNDRTVAGGMLCGVIIFRDSMLRRLLRGLWTEWILRKCPAVALIQAYNLEYTLPPATVVIRPLRVTVQIGTRRYRFRVPSSDA